MKIDYKNVYFCYRYTIVFEFFFFLLNTFCFRFNVFSAKSDSNPYP